MNSCSAPNCTGATRALKLCWKHYKRWRNHGSIELIRGGDPFVRFMAKVKKTPSCWLWTGTQQRNSSYGQFWRKGKLVRPHRFAYEYFVGPIPDGLTIDHLCGVPLCVNPKHLFTGTQSDNVKDMIAKGRAIPPKPHAYGEMAKNASLTKEQARIAKYWVSLGNWSQAKIAKYFKVSPMVISRIVNSQTRSYHEDT